MLLTFHRCYQQSFAFAAKLICRKSSSSIRQPLRCVNDFLFCLLRTSSKWTMIVTLSLLSLIQLTVLTDSLNSYDPQLPGSSSRVLTRKETHHCLSSSLSAIKLFSIWSTLPHWFVTAGDWWPTRAMRRWRNKLSAQSIWPRQIKWISLIWHCEHLLLNRIRNDLFFQFNSIPNRRTVLVIKSILVEELWWNDSFFPSTCSSRLAKYLYSTSDLSCGTKQLGNIILLVRSRSSVNLWNDNQCEYYCHLSIRK